MPIPGVEWLGTRQSDSVGSPLGRITCAVWPQARDVASLSHGLILSRCLPCMRRGNRCVTWTPGLEPLELGANLSFCPSEASQERRPHVGGASALVSVTCFLSKSVEKPRPPCPSLWVPGPQWGRDPNPPLRLPGLAPPQGPGQVFPLCPLTPTAPRAET